MDDPWASVEAIEAVSGGDGEPMTAPAFRISMGSAESAKSCFLVFYDTTQTPYAAICCEVDPDNGGQSGGFEAAFTNPDLTEGATLERITEENKNRIAGEFAEKDGTAESWTSTFAEAPVSYTHLIEAILKLLRCTSFEGSASISSTQARRASGM